MNITNHKKTILIIIVTLLVFFGYWYFFISNNDAANDANNQSGITNTSPSVSNTQYDKEFVESLLSLSYISLDVSVLNTKTYQALNFPEIPFIVNFSRESGRDNPFLPIGTDSINTNSNIQSQLNTNINSTSTPISAPTSISTTTVNTNTRSTTTVNPIRRNF